MKNIIVVDLLNWRDKRDKQEKMGETGIDITKSKLCLSKYLDPAGDVQIMWYTTAASSGSKLLWPSVNENK